MLCDLLAQAGVAGAPQSFFRPASVPQFVQQWNLPPEGDAWGARYVEYVVRHASAGTGCVGLRIMWSDMGPFLERLHTLFPRSGSDTAVLAASLGIDRFVHLVREDRIAQAVSLVLAEQTGLWHRHADGTERQRSRPAQPPRYDFAQLDRAVGLLDAEARGWSAWFADRAVTPLRVTYEELADDLTATVRRVVDHIGGGDVAVPEPDTSLLSNDINREWARRYRNERRHEGGGHAAPTSTTR